ncbi:MAG: DUF4440 domain-containing protein [Acidimicrobiales bacterium]|nr:DUF4440 domain-containing protein [Acidimicrobiales bacterium]
MLDLDDLLERNRQAVGAVGRGDAEPILALYADTDDITLGNPFGPFVRGRAAVMATVRAAATRYADGELGSFDTLARHEAGGLACVVQTERFSARLGGAPERTELALRCTSVYRREEDGGWRLVHRHADPITTPRGTESLAGG